VAVCLIPVDPPVAHSVVLSGFNLPRAALYGKLTAGRFYDNLAIVLAEETRMRYR
jgi:hypothetical protein